MKKILSITLCLFIAMLGFSQFSLGDQKLPEVEQIESVVIKSNKCELQPQTVNLLNFKQTRDKDLSKLTIITSWVIINSIMTYAYVKQDDKSTASTLGYVTLTGASTALCITLLITF